MNNSPGPPARIPVELTQAPAFPSGPGRVFRELRKSLDFAEFGPERSLSQKLFARLVGAPRSTINDWLNSELADPIRCFVCGLERLSEANRSDFLRKICRHCPRLQDARLAHDPRALNGLRALLAKPAGLAFIAGPSDLRTYVITALGHAANCEIRGFDVHAPKKFVPVQGVLYPRKAGSPAEMRRLAREAWPMIAEGAARLVLLNGIWRVAPELQKQIIRLAAKRQVIISDDFANRPPALDKHTSGHVVTVSHLDLGRFSIRIEALGAAR